MNAARAHRSIGWRVVSSLLLLELLFGVVLGAVAGLFWALSVVDEHRRATEQTASVLAAAVMPLVADQQQTRLADELDRLVNKSGLAGVHCIHVVDSSGHTVASHGEEDIPLDAVAGRPRTLRSLLLESQIVRRPVLVDGLEVASVYVMFAPPDVTALGASSAGVLGLVVAAVMVVSAPWTLWLVSREIVEPLDDLERAASRIAGGDYRPKFMPSPVREISRVQTALTAMARQLAERQQELNDSYDALAEAYESLERANRDIEQLAQVKADFVAVAAHEIRAPLATIRLYADLLESGELGRLDEGAARAVDAIGAAAKRLGSITADLMDSALLERGLLPIRLEPMRIDRVVSEAVRDAEPAADARSMELRLSGPVEETTIIGDALRIRQVLDNLVSNAIKYSSEGAAVDVRMTAQPDWVTIDVTDRGRGIAESDRGRLFTLFGRIDFGDSREAAGLGLGLAISARIAQAHGGSVSFRANEEGVGSVFSLRLPVTGPAGANGEGVAIRVVGEEEQP